MKVEIKNWAGQYKIKTVRSTKFSHWQEGTKFDQQSSIMPHYHRLVIYFDGASRNNPRGPAGCGWNIYFMNNDGADDYQIARGQKYLRYNKSNNQAEYEGLEAALQYMDDNSISCNGLYIRGDSQIVINQLDGIYQVRSSNIKPYYDCVKNLLDRVDYGYVNYKHIDRSRNSQADRLANDAINEERDYLSD